MASVNYLKCKAGSGAAGALMRHCDKDERLQHEHNNEHINPMLTATNSQTYSYANAIARLRDRLADLDNTTNTNHRKDRVECFALESTVPDGMRAVDFGNLMLRAVTAQYGRDNVISAYIHRDEIHDYIDHGEVRTSKPHVHIFVVPEHDGQLNGKWFSSRANMVQLNKTIDAQCRERGCVYMTGEHPRNRTVEELKIESYRSAQAETVRAEQDLSRARERLVETQGQVKACEDRSKALEVKMGRLEGEVQQLDTALVAARKNIAEYEPKKRLFRAPMVEVPPAEWEAVKERAVLNDKLGTLQLRDDARAVKELADKYLASAETQSKQLIADAQARGWDLERQYHFAAEQLQEIRRDFPEVDRCFANDIYQGRDWPDRQRDHDRYRSSERER